MINGMCNDKYDIFKIVEWYLKWYVFFMNSKFLVMSSYYLWLFDSSLKCAIVE